MAVTNFSPLLGLALPTTGDLSGTWGTVVNDSITQLLDSAVAGTTTLSADTDVTLSTTNGAANQARNAVILWTATGTVTRNITAPAQSKAYLVINSTGGTQEIVIRGAGPTTGVTIPAGARALVAWDGSDFVKVVSNPVVLTSDVSGTLPVANGGTGIATLTANNVLLGNGTSAPLFVAPGTVGNVLTSTGTTWASAPSATGGGDVTLNGVQTLTNKTIAFADNTLTGVAGTTATQTLTNKTLTAPESTGAIFDNGSVRGNVVAVAALDIDCTAGNYFTKTISGNSTFTFSSPPSSRSYAFTLELTHTSGTVTWPVEVQWPGGTAPTLTNAKTSLFMFVTDDGGTRWRGAALVDYTT
jgi:hypothetical protein